MKVRTAFGKDGRTPIRYWRVGAAQFSHMTLLFCAIMNTKIVDQMASLGRSIESFSRRLDSSALSHFTTTCVFFLRKFLSTGNMSWELLPGSLMRRLGLYLVLLMTRGWVLHVAFNAIEDRIVGPLPCGSCWYRDWLVPTDAPTCHGRVFDFSDHIVLYFSQILPIALLEVLHALEHPYWNKHTSTRLSPYLHSTVSDSTAVEVTRRLVPVTLIGEMMYLYFITFLGVYRTATYFHAGSEIVTGWAVSLLIHVPLH